MADISARGEFNRVVEQCSQRLQGGVGTSYDTMMVLVQKHINECEKRLAELMLEKDYYWTKELTAQEKINVNTSILNSEGL